MSLALAEQSNTCALASAPMLPHVRGHTVQHNAAVHAEPAHRMSAGLAAMSLALAEQSNTCALASAPMLPHVRGGGETLQTAQ